MQFTTPIPIKPSDRPIGYDSRIVSLGSCFAENMAEKFDYFKFRNCCNPFGILFHPMAIAAILRRIISGERFEEDDIFAHNGLWHSFDIHSELSHPDSQTLLANLNSLLEKSKLQLQTATHLTITYGTSWAYRIKRSGKRVANCHKVPQSEFEKELLPAAEIQIAIESTIGMILSFNSDCTVIFTVSPVRHIKDGFVENQRSKAHLITAIHDTISALPLVQHSPVTYFPSYEIMMDELRDYRFYAEDLLHPSQMAIDYIWERFTDTHIAASALPIMHEVGSIQKALAHKPFHPNSESHGLFVSKLQARIAQLQLQFPHLQF